ncbi:MAG: DUF2064 domain-containing protein [Thermoanaerobaculia bacterium]
MPHRAVLVFARSPRAEAAAKGVDRYAGIFRAVAGAWLRAAASCGAVPVIACDERDEPAFRGVTCIAQRGVSFGERLANAAADVFAAGFETLLITGIDTPPSQSLGEAFSAVESGDVPAAIAPSTDGGINAIVLRREHASILASFAPRDPNLFDGCFAHFGGRVFLLPASTDIDSPAALDAARRQSLWRPYFAPASRAFAGRLVKPRCVAQACALLRAPPRAA